VKHGYGSDGYDEIEYVREENMKKDIWTGGRARNMENRKLPGIEEL
jgi:hypothetical protein